MILIRHEYTQLGDQKSLVINFKSYYIYIYIYIITFIQYFMVLCPSKCQYITVNTHNTEDFSVENAMISDTASLVPL